MALTFKRKILVHCGDCIRRIERERALTRLDRCIVCQSHRATPGIVVLVITQSSVRAHTTAREGQRLSAHRDIVLQFKSSAAGHRHSTGCGPRALAVPKHQHARVHGRRAGVGVRTGKRHCISRRLGQAHATPENSRNGTVLHIIGCATGQCAA